MHILILAVVAAFVVGVLAVAAFALFELTPFAHHTEHFRDPASGKRLHDSPRLD